jgi:predicted transcriptional regulator
MRRRTGKKYDVFSYPTKEDVVAKAIQFAQQGKSLLFSVEGQKEQTLFGTQTLERLFAEVGVDPQDILRIDSASLADPSHPANVEKINQLAKQYRIVLTSPAISSCVSIEDGPFDAVFDVSAGLQSVAETRQRYDRVRAFEDEKGRYTNVDRHVFVPKISTIRYGNGSFRAEDMIAGKHRLDEFAMELLRADCLINRTSLANFNAVTLQTWAEKASRRNLEALAYRDRVEYLCVSEGARWIEVEEVVCTQGVKDLMKRIREENVARHHDAICAAKKIDIEKALALGRKRALTVTEALELRRWEIEDRYGREVDREILALDDNPGLYKKLRLHFYLRNLDVAKKLDARQVERLESHPLPYHKPDLKLVAAKAFVLKQLGVERFLDPEREFTGTSPEVVEFVASVISFKEDLAKMFGIQLSGTASPMQVVGQFLALIGVKLKSHRRREGEGKIPRYYAFEGYEDDRFLFFQYWRAKAFEILGEVDPALTIEIENQPIAPPDRPQKGDSVAWKKGDRLVSGFYLEDIEGDTARIKERELGISFQVPLSSLEISL